MPPPSHCLSSSHHGHALPLSVFDIPHHSPPNLLTHPLCTLVGLMSLILPLSISLLPLAMHILHWCLHAGKRLLLHFIHSYPNLLHHLLEQIWLVVPLMFISTLCPSLMLQLIINQLCLILTGSKLWWSSSLHFLRIILGP